MKKQKCLFPLIIIISLLIISINSYALFQFNKYEFKNQTIYNNEFTPEIFIINLFNQYYTIINVGNPPQKTETQISLYDYGLIMKENICLTSNYYNKNKSLTLEDNHDYDYLQYSKKITIVDDDIIFPIYNITTNNLSQIPIQKYIFTYDKTNKTEQSIEKDKEDKSCVVLGFKLMCDYSMVICKNIPDYLKRNKLINAYNFYFLYHNEKEKMENGGYDLSLIIGENPHEYNSEKYHENNFIRAPALKYLSEPTLTLDYRIYYFYNGNKIQFNFTSFEEKIKATFWFNLSYIIGMNDYLKSIKANYFDKYEKECNVTLVNTRYTVISCNKNFNTENFPTLYFYNTEYNYPFELTYKDLFKTIGNKKYFLILFDLKSNYPWKFGKLFLEKYFFSFDMNSKTIGFYTDLYNNKNDSKSNSNNSNNKPKSFKLLWIILGLLCILLIGISCFLLGKLIYGKKPKKRANELDDDYAYVAKNNEGESSANDSKNNKFGIN